MKPENILEQEARLLKAMKAADVPVLDELLHDELLFNIPGGHTLTKAMDLENYRSGAMKISEIQASDLQVSQMGEVAVVVCTVRMEGFFQTAPLDGTYRILRVWKHRAGTWKVIAGSSMPA